MSSAAPSPLISPDLRRRLQQRYDEALRLAAQQPCDNARVHGLLAECVQADPGSDLYLDALLNNLRRWQPAPRRSWWPQWLRGSVQVRAGDEESIQSNEDELRSSTRLLSTQYSVLSEAPRKLLTGYQNPAQLRQLAIAAEACDFDEVELRYLTAAHEVSPNDPEMLRLLSRALTRQGRFEEAAAEWSKLLPHHPDDEATQALEDLRMESGLAAEEARLDNALAGSGSTLSLIQERENVRLARSRQRIEIARRRAAHDAHPKAQLLVRQFEAEYLRLEIEILHLRCERLPGDWLVRVELARRLKQAGNYSGAIQRLDEVNRMQPDEPAVLVELGECWQHLRQYDKALDYYRQATALGSPSAEMKLANYRAAVLLAALARRDEARRHLEAVLAADPSFKDARERLDKLQTG